ncbi:protein PYRICULARIA ORYZAE RESISTANCE 21 [Drosophila rhopaloa]|uniref:Uncharacterized protein LOC108045042 n=1 Tax=Drosophila rhopaloa TaxID=1041015 RepID=A0A6P4EX85_DRORH|nr:protein PYRICULARIA ORYZAE RESISTANCE 21 [Drosophila rhopaloa]
MGVLQNVHRSLLMQHKVVPLTIKRMYDTQIRIAIRKKRVEFQKALLAPCPESGCKQPPLMLPKPECQDDPCADMELPMDLEHYTPSDKAKRKYQRTWCECYFIPKAAVQAKKKYPNRPRRPLRCVATEVFECRDEDMNPPDKSRLKPEKLIDVPRIGEWPCCKIPAPGCPKSRNPPSCDAGRIPSCCKKRRTQYPSFSECIKVGLLDPIPPCECEKKVNLCDVWAYWRRKHH